jgi:hypothetical protein
MNALNLADENYVHRLCRSGALVARKVGRVWDIDPDKPMLDVVVAATEARSVPRIERSSDRTPTRAGARQFLVPRQTSASESVCGVLQDQ